MPPVKSPVPPAALRAAEALGDRRARPQPAWLARLLGVPPRGVTGPLREAGSFLALEREVRATHRAAGRTFYAQFRAPLELYALVRFLKPRHIVETGVSSGVSSLHFLLGLEANGAGTLHSIDFPTRQKGPVFGPRDSPVALPPGRSSGWAVPDPLRDRWDLRIGPSQKLLPELVAEVGSVDLFLHDSLHTPRHLTFELETIRPKLSAGAVVLADNTAWTGAAFPKFAASLGVRPARRGWTDLVGLRVPVSSD